MMIQPELFSDDYISSLESREEMRRRLLRRVTTEVPSEASNRRSFNIAIGRGIVVQDQTTLRGIVRSRGKRAALRPGLRVHDSKGARKNSGIGA